ncbi:hypothetical protein AD951_04505, partial [Acetobacter malorum]
WGRRGLTEDLAQSSGVLRGAEWSGGQSGGFCFVDKAKSASLIKVFCYQIKNQRGGEAGWKGGSLPAMRPAKGGRTGQFLPLLRRALVRKQRIICGLPCSWCAGGWLDLS